MKRFLPLLALLGLCSTAWGIGDVPSTGTVKNDERDLSYFSEKDKDEDALRKKYRKNPRNAAFPESFDRVEEQEREEDVSEDDPFVDNKGNGQTTNDPTETLKVDP